MVVAWGIVIALGLEEALVALVAMLLLAAAIPLGVLAGNLARQLPGPLGGLANGVVLATEVAIRSQLAWAQSAGQGLASLISAPFQAIWTDLRALVVATEHLYWSQHRMRTVTVPAIYAWTWTELVRAYQSAIAHADQVGARDLAYARQLVVQAMARADAEHVQALLHAEQLARAEQEYAHQLVVQAMARADVEFGQATRYAEQLALAEQAYAGDLFRESLDYARSAAAGAEAYARGLGLLVEDYARSLTGTAIAHADQVGAAAVGAAAVATAAVAVRVQAIEQSPCQRFCSPLGDIGGLLQALADAGLLAALLALVQEARSHPELVARELDDVFRPAAQAAARSLRLGIPG